MAQTKLYAPKGMHFMVNSNGGFYLMKNPSTGYTAHTLSNGDKSSDYILMTYRTTHPSSIRAGSSSAAASTVGPTVQTTAGTVTNTGSRVSRNTTTSSGGY